MSEVRILPFRPSRDWLAIGAVAFLLLLIVCTLIPGLIAPHDPGTLDVVNRLKPPSSAHLFGTDEAGRDIFSRVVHGTRYSLGVALAIVASAVVIGTIYGLISGMAARWLDNMMMRFVDLVFGFPALVLAFAISAAIGRGLDSVTIALALIWWPGFARLVRGEVLRVKGLPHVDAARAMGVPGRRIVTRHIPPFVLGAVNVRATTDVGYALVAVTALSFLGLGATSPTPEWGLLIRDSRPYFGTTWWYLVFPGGIIMLTATAFSLVGDALDRGH